MSDNLPVRWHRSGAGGLPWSAQLPLHLSVDQPHTIQEFEAWPDLDQAADTHLTYLRTVDRQISTRWEASWEDVYAVGPFIGRRRRLPKIPFVLVAEYRRPYRHLLKLSKLLARPYQEFAILPDIHLMTARTKRELEDIHNWTWTQTKLASIRWSRI